MKEKKYIINNGIYGYVRKNGFIIYTTLISLLHRVFFARLLAGALKRVYFYFPVKYRISASPNGPFTFFSLQ